LAGQRKQHRREQQNERIFATKSALTSKGQRGPGRSEVVLDQAILGLLINGRQRLPWGVKK
jgi:hypothetical protein